MRFKFDTKNIYVVEKSMVRTSCCFGKCECGIFFSRDYWQRDHVVATLPKDLARDADASFYVGHVGTDFILALTSGYFFGSAFFDCLIRQHPTFAANVHPIIIVHRNSIQAASIAHST